MVIRRRQAALFFFFFLLCLKLIIKFSGQSLDKSSVGEYNIFLNIENDPLLDSAEKLQSNSPVR